MTAQRHGGPLEALRTPASSRVRWPAQSCPLALQHLPSHLSALLRGLAPHDTASCQRAFGGCRPNLFYAARFALRRVVDILSITSCALLSSPRRR